MRPSRGAVSGTYVRAALVLNCCRFCSLVRWIETLSVLGVVASVGPMVLARPVKAL